MPGEIAFWLAAVSPAREDGTLDPTALVLEHAAAVLYAQENARLARLRHSDDRRSYLAAHAGARLILGRRLNRPPDTLQFRAPANYKPNLLTPPQEIDFSLSHARGVVAVAVARMPTGVDVEPLREIEHLDSMSELILAAEEQAVLRNTPEAFRSRLFLRYWTLKEALLKAAGLGFAVAPNTVVIDAGPARLPASPDCRSDFHIEGALLPIVGRYDLATNCLHIAVLRQVSRSVSTIAYSTKIALKLYDTTRGPQCLNFWSRERIRTRSLHSRFIAAMAWLW